MLPDDAEDRGRALLKRAMGSIRLQFVVFDEVDAGFDQGAHLGCSFFWAHPHARFDDGADERPVFHAGKPARACDPKLRPLVAIEKSGAAA